MKKLRRVVLGEGTYGLSMGGHVCLNEKYLFWDKIKFGQKIRIIAEVLE